MLTQRRLVPEMMDDPAVDETELDASLGFIRFVNRRLGGAAAAVNCFRRWSRHWPRDRTIRIIDLGTGSGDIPLAIADWAREAGLRVHITGVDFHEKTLGLARAHVGDRPEIELHQADALKLMDSFEPGSFDYAHAGMFLHHLEDIDVLTVLRIMDRLTTRGVIWNDLIRGGLPRAAVRVIATLPSKLPAIAKHDAVVSVDAGFTKRDALEFARRVGLVQVHYRRHMLYRFTLTSSKQG